VSRPLHSIASLILIAEDGEHHSRVQDDDTPREGEGSPQSDNENGKSTTPPPSSSVLPPSTPATVMKNDKVPSTEGKETKHIRERVAAMKASGSGQGNKSQDTEIAEVSGGEEAKTTTTTTREGGKEEQDKEMKELSGRAKVAAEVNEVAKEIQKEDTEIADTAAETAQVAEEVPETKAAKSVS